MSRFRFELMHPAPRRPVETLGPNSRPQNITGTSFVGKWGLGAPTTSTQIRLMRNRATSFGSCRIRGPDAPGNFRTLLPLDHADVILSLQVQPELRAVAEIAAKPHRGIRRDPTTAIEDVGDATGRHADIERETVSTQLSSRHLAFQQTAGVYNRSHGINLGGNPRFRLRARRPCEIRNKYASGRSPSSPIVPADFLLACAG